MEIASEVQPSLNLFHNTISLRGSELEEADNRCARQEQSIMDFFKSTPGDHTPSEVSVHFPQWPITSIRRAMTNLTDRGMLVKLDKQRKGQYGIANHCWRLA